MAAQFLLVAEVRIRRPGKYSDRMWSTDMPAEETLCRLPTQGHRRKQPGLLRVSTRLPKVVLRPRCPIGRRNLALHSLADEVPFTIKGFLRDCRPESCRCAHDSHGGALLGTTDARAHRPAPAAASQSFWLSPSEPRCARSTCVCSVVSSTPAYRSLRPGCRCSSHRR